MRVPIGVVGIIYESRPNVTADAAGLCLKSGNAVILRGGSEALHTNQAIAACVTRACATPACPSGAVQVDRHHRPRRRRPPDRRREHVDVIMPRGGKSLIERITTGRQSRSSSTRRHLPRLRRRRADLDMADPHRRQRQDAALLGVQRDGDAARPPRRRRARAAAARGHLLRANGVELRGCERTRALVPAMKAATEEDWYTEYLAPILSVRVVDSLDDAIAHIAKYGSQHTDAIVTDNFADALRFLRDVDSSAVLVNASTRFTDGFEFGLRRRDRHLDQQAARPRPVGLEGLTSQKWVVLGTGQIRG